MKGAGASEGAGIVFPTPLENKISPVNQCRGDEEF